MFYNLDLFDQEITKYGNVLAQVMEQETTTEIAWLRVLANPIQRQLVDKINKWKWKFTSHLYDDIVDKLSNLSTFMKDATKGLQQEVENGGWRGTDQPNHCRWKCHFQVIACEFMHFSQQMIAGAPKNQMSGSSR